MLKNLWNKLWWPFKVAVWFALGAIVLGLAIGCYEHLYNDMDEIESLNSQLYVVNGKLENTRNAYLNALEVIDEAGVAKVDTVNNRITIPLSNTHVTDAQRKLDTFYHLVLNNDNK